MDKANKKMRGLCLVIMCIAAVAQAAGKENVFRWYDGGPNISYSLSKGVSPVVATATSEGQGRVERGSFTLTLSQNRA